MVTHYKNQFTFPSNNNMKQWIKELNPELTISGQAKKIYKKWTGSNIATTAGTKEVAPHKYHTCTPKSPES